MSGEPAIFVTGASGLVGRAVAELLANAQPDRRIFILARRPESAPSGTNITAIRGDITEDRLGLSGVDYQRLAESVTGILHAAADTRFDLPLSAARLVNTAGTARVLELARRSPHLERFLHIGTVHVNGLRRGDFHEEPIPAGHGYINTYQQSKHEAERIVLDAMRDVPASIFRLSTIAADSASGHISQFNYIHQIIRHLRSSPLEMIPGDPEVRLDLIDNQWATSAIAWLFEHRFTPGTVRHICAGPQATLSVREAFELGLRAVPEAAGAVPRLVSPAEFARYLAMHPGQGVRELNGVLRRFLPLLSLRSLYHNERATAELTASGIVRPDIREYFEKVVVGSVERDWSEPGNGSRP